LPCVDGTGLDLPRALADRVALRGPVEAPQKGSIPMQRPKDPRPRSWAGPLIVIVLAILALGGFALGWNRLHARKPLAERYAVTNVRRADLQPIIKAGGTVQSGKQTIVECRLENLSVRVRGQALSAGGASILIQLIPEGTEVKKGDVLAVLDSADYTELLRVQKIDVERAQADKLQAELDHEIAKLAVVEYRDGTMKELIEDFQRRLSLARSDLQRARDRLDWTHAMKSKGYVSESTVKSDEFTTAQLELALKQEEGAFHVFGKFTAPRTLRELEGAVLGTGATLDYRILRAERQKGRLATLQRQVDACTIRAPHDGYVVYANDARREIFIAEGMPVRQNQKLFYLPDLNDMEVLALLNESIVKEVRSGMRARVRVEGMPDRIMWGLVTKVAQVAVPDWQSDVRCYEGTVKLEAPTDGLKPGMTAQVELEMPQRDDVLTVPSEAVTSADGEHVCFVIRGDGLERRPVKLGRVTEVMTEVTEGLREGEQVVMNPHPDDIELEELVSQPAAIAPAAIAPAAADSSPGEIAASR
jgi:HlyD family secretion protein